MLKAGGGCMYRVFTPDGTALHELALDVEVTEHALHDVQPPSTASMHKIFDSERARNMAMTGNMSAMDVASCQTM